MLRRPILSVGIGLILTCVSGTTILVTVATGFSLEKCFNEKKRQLAHRHPRYLTTAAPKGLTSILGVLRRPATHADSIPSATLRQVNPSEYRVLWPRATRLLGIGPDGTRYFLVVGFRSPPGVPTACIRHHGEHPRVTGPDGVVATIVWRAKIAGGSSTGALPYAPAWISKGIAVSIQPTELRTAFAPFFGVVPDGVARIVVSVGAHAPTQALVANNFVISQVPNPQQGDSILQQWYAADGTLVKSIKQGPLTILTTG